MNMPGDPHTMTPSDVLEKLVEASYSTSTDLADAIGRVFDEHPKEIPSGFTPTDVILVGRQEGLLDFKADGVRIVVTRTTD